MFKELFLMQYEFYLCFPPGTQKRRQLKEKPFPKWFFFLPAYVTVEILLNSKLINVNIDCIGFMLMLDTRDYESWLIFYSLQKNKQSAYWMLVDLLYGYRKRNKKVPTECIKKFPFFHMQVLLAWRVGPNI